MLIRRAQNGDRSAIDEIMSRYEPLAFNTRRMAPTDDLMDDYEQIARIAVFKAIPKYKEMRGRKPSYFFFEAVRMAVRNFFNTERRWMSRFDLADMNEYGAHFEEETINAIDASRMTTGLPTDYLDLLEKYYVRGLSSGDISRQGDVKIAAVDMKRKYIIKKIRLAMSVELAA